MYGEYRAMLAEQKGSKSHVYGLKSVCGLTHLQYYHPADNDTCDIMHDILEGVASFEVNLFLRDVVLKRKLISLPDFNCIASHFEFGSIMSSSKPSEVLLS